MNYSELKWGELKREATKLGIKTKGKNKVKILQEIYSIIQNPNQVDLEDSIEEIKEETLSEDLRVTHPIFEDDRLSLVLPSVKAFKELGGVPSSDANINRMVAELFMQYIETDKNAVINTKCDDCTVRYYQRFIPNYDRLALEYGEETL